MAIRHHAQPDTRASALVGLISAEREQFRQCFLDLREHAFPFAFLVRPENGDRRGFEGRIEALRLLAQTVDQGKQYRLGCNLHGLYRAASVLTVGLPAAPSKDRNSFSRLWRASGT